MASDSTKQARRWARRAAKLAAAVLLLLLAAALVALHLPSVQQDLYRRATAELEARTGLRLEAEAVRLRPFGFRLDLIRPELAVGGAEPFLTAESLMIEVAPLSLVRGPLRLRTIELIAPRLDGTRPQPRLSELAGDAGDRPPAPPPVVIERLWVTEGAAAGFDLPQAAGSLLGPLTVEGLDLEGRLVEGQLILAARVGRLRSAAEGRPPLDVAVEADLNGALAGPLRLDRLVVDGEAISVTASGLLGLSADQPLAMELEAEADPARLLGVEVDGSRLRLAGRLDLRREDGELELEASGLPGELARPWLPAELFERAALTGSLLETSGTVTLSQGGLAATAEAGWLRGRDALATATLAVSGEAADPELLVEVDLRLLPRAAGERRLEARLQVPREAPADTRVEAGRLWLAVPDAEEELARLAAIWPGLLPALPAGLARGPLRAEGSFEGALAEMTTSVQAEWAPAPGASVRLSARGSLPPRPLEARVDVDRVPLGRFLDDVRGSLAGTATLTLTGDHVAGELELAGDGLGRDGLTIDAARLVASFDGPHARLGELSLRQGDRTLLAAGNLELGRRAVADLELGLEGGWGPLTSAAGRLRLADGVLRLEVPRADLAGVVAQLSVAAPLGALASLPGGEALRDLPLELAEGRLEVAWDQPAIDWRAALGTDVAGEGAADGPWLAGTRGRLALDPTAPASAEGEFELVDLALTQGGHTLVAVSPLRLTLAARRLALEPAAIALDGHPVDLGGEASVAPGWSLTDSLELLVEEARLAAATEAAAPLVAAEVEALLRGGRLELAGRAPLRDGGEARLRAAAPLVSLTRGEGLVELSWEVPAVDWAPWLTDPTEEESVLTRLVAGTTGRLDLDLAEPVKATGELRLTALEADLDGQSVRARETVELRLADGRLEVVSAQLLASGAPLDLAGRVDLEPAWRPGAPLADLARDLSLTGGGELPAALFNPFLGGGAGEGVLLAELEIGGPPDAAQGRLQLRGPGAGFYFVAPYSLEVSEPEVNVLLEAGSATFDGAARVNEGRLRFVGRADPRDGVGLEAGLEGVRAVLDYGLLVLLGGDLRLTLSPEGEGLLSGRLIVDSGQLTRPLRLEDLLLEQLLPADLLGTELDPLEAVALDLRLETRQGVRVKNNLADLKVRWEPVAVRGNLVQPVIEGRLEVDPGGLVYAYGQTLRLDSATVEYRGLPLETPALDLQTTTSIEDPSIQRLAGNDPFTDRRRERRSSSADGPGARVIAGEALTTGLASFLGEHFDDAVGGALGSAGITFRPVPVFGETDPGARLTASSQVSSRVTVAASLDLRNAERKTYLVDLHDEQAVAGLSAQLFTNDFGAEGGTLRQHFEFGGSERRQVGPRLRRLEIDSVPGVRRRALKGAVGYRKGERLRQGAAFEVSVAVGEVLRVKGYPDARVRVEETPSSGRPGTVLAVRVHTGPHVDFRFTGKRLPRKLRRAVTHLYRGDFYEPVAIEEMRGEATRAWRSRGFLDPQIEIRRETLAPGPPEQRLVTVESQPGERLEMGPPRFAGLPAEESAELAALYDGTLRRMELAAGLEAAERRALEGLAALGYPDAVLRERHVSEDGRQLTVEVEPGERLRLEALELVYGSGQRTEVGEAGGIRVGDPVRADRLARAALEVEDGLRNAGYLEARVTLGLESMGPERPAGRKAVFQLERGPMHRLAAAEFAGLAATRPAWARRTSGLKENQPLTRDGLRDARRRLYGTGLFSAVSSSIEPAGEEETYRVLFDVLEEARYWVDWGLRWESDEGTSVVVDLLDRNFLGRGVELGLRSLWSDDLQELRFSSAVPGVLGPKSSLRLFALASEEEELVEEGEILDQTRTIEGTLQLSLGLTPRTTGRVYGRYRDVRFTETFLVEDPFFGPLDPIEVTFRQPSLGLEYIFDGRDDSVAPRRGLFASIDLSFSDEIIGGDIGYARLFGQLHSFRPAGRLAGRRLTWAQSARVGRAEAFAGQELTADLLLRAGGEYSVRGYQRESLGPPALTGTLLPSIPVNTLLVLNEELRFDLWDPVSGVLFVDAGNVWIDRDIDFDLFTSAGFGLRAATPFGLLRLDLAWPLDQREGIDPDLKIYFGLGNVF